MSVGPREIVVILLVVMLLFGSSRIAELGKGLGEGIKNFKKGMAEEDNVPPRPPQRLEVQPEPASERDTDRVRDDRA